VEISRRSAATAHLSPGIPSWELYGELHPVTGSGLRHDVRGILIGREDLVENGSELYFSPGAAGLDVAQHALQVPDAGSEALHFSETAVDLLQPFADLPERLSQPFLQGRVELFVHGCAHLVELPAVLVLQGFEAGIHGLAEPFKFLFVGFRQGVHLPGECVQLVLLQRGDFRDAGGEGLAEGGERAGQLSPGFAGM